MTREYTLDLETTTTHDHIWICAGEDSEGSTFIDRDGAAVSKRLENYDITITHNGIDFDLPVLRNCWNCDTGALRHVDTILLSRLYNPALSGGHSLSAWGHRLGYPKGDFTDYNAPAAQVFSHTEPAYLEDIWTYDRIYDEDVIEVIEIPAKDVYRLETTEEWQARMIVYAKQDVAITTKLKKHLEALLAKEGFTGDCVELEHKTAVELRRQRDTGFKLDIDKANLFYGELNTEMLEIEATMQAMFPPIVTKRYHKTSGKPLADGVEVFNVGSRVQVAERLASIGVKFTKKTDGGGVKIDETVLKDLDTPESLMIAKYLKLQKLVGLVGKWLECVEPDGRVRGKVIGCGAVTGRMTHSNPNMAQIPSASKDPIYGKRCRECWIVDKGNKLIGFDASGLELRMLAHYMQDQDYIDTILDEDADIHVANMNAAGLTTRDQAKTFIYAFNYGAGAAKLGSIIGGGAKEGSALKKKFLKNNPALKKLIETIEKIASRNKSVPALDGRRLRIREVYRALNTLLQGNGAVVMKRALIIFSDRLRENGLYDIVRVVANVHDELQVEAPEYLADTVGRMGVQAIRDAGDYYNMRCPLDGEYKIGDSWAETH
jgi:DNA polymerase I-like protein with 3'-5' exonuclease and polymerase domains